jgi:hypothetical protein
MKYQELIETIDSEQLQATLRNHFDFMWKFQITPNGFINIFGHCNLRGQLPMLPIKFGKVSGDFTCSHAHLVSLEGAPRKVGGTFQCQVNDLSSLIGGPTYVGGSFDCYGNKLTSLVGAPKHVGGSFYCQGNDLVSLEGFPERIGEDFLCDWSPNLPLLRSLKSGKGVLIWDNNRGIRHPVDKIINQFISYKNLRHAILDCQKALIEAGYAGNARW